MRGARVALVEDDPEWAQLVEMGLRHAGFQVSSFGTPQKFLRALPSDIPEAAVVDMILPGIQGRELIMILRRDPRTRRLPIVGMSASEVSPRSAVIGIEAGADEYLRKPFDPALLAVRLENLFARAGVAPPPPAPKPVEAWDVTDGPIALQTASRACRIDGKAVELTRLEFDLLAHFLGQPGRVLTRRHLTDVFWPERAATGQTRSLDKHVERLRKLLGKHGGRLEMVYGVGYVWRRKGGGL